LDSDRAKFLSQPRVDCRWAETVKTAPSDRAILERYGRVERACSRPPLPGAPGIGPPIDIRFLQVDRILIAIVCRTCDDVVSQSLADGPGRIERQPPQLQRAVRFIEPQRAEPTFRE